MITVKETIVVEGAYDKIKLNSVVNANVLVTGGFCIFKNKEMQRLMKRLAQKDGIVVLTDSDRAGFLIRNFIKSCTAGETVLQRLYQNKRERKEKNRTWKGRAFGR